ncbi:hypothetical protein HDU97_004706 [Phlyctochytrium planicorne]|nr:hypothetical protein HDU97_004706 [Phlyctochytrium planicorne]
MASSNDDAEVDAITLTPAILASRWTTGGVGGTNGGENYKKKKTSQQQPSQQPSKPSLPSLQDFEAADCSKMNIGTVDDISGAVNLARLNLSSNRIDGEGLEGLRHLLNLSHNKILRIPEPVVKLKKLKALILNNNEIVRIDNVGGLTALNALILSHNKITEIPQLRSLTSLTKLSLSHNSLRHFPDLTSLPSLRELRLSHNRILTLNPMPPRTDSLLTLPALEILDVSSNLLAKLDDVVQPFKEARLIGLVNLNLRGNGVCGIEGYKEEVLGCFEGVRVFDMERIDERFLKRKERKEERRKREEYEEMKERKKLEREKAIAEGRSVDGKKKGEKGGVGGKRKRGEEGAEGGDGGRRKKVVREKFDGKPGDRPARSKAGVERKPRDAAFKAGPKAPAKVEEVEPEPGVKKPKRKAVAPGEDELAESVAVRGQVFKGMGPRPPQALEEEDVGGKGAAKGGKGGKEKLPRPMPNGKAVKPEKEVSEDQRKKRKVDEDDFFMEDFKASKSAVKVAPVKKSVDKVKALKPARDVSPEREREELKEEVEARKQRSGVVGVVEVKKVKKDVAMPFEVSKVKSGDGGDGKGGKGTGLAPAWD